MKKVIILNKKEGQTPLEALELFRNKNKSYAGLPMTYAGRLDPMASGLLLVLADAETKNKEKYLGLDKEYEFEVLFGFATDTYDILGKVNEYGFSEGLTASEIEKKIKSFTGKIMQKYPLYSSKNIKKVLAGEDVESTAKEVHIHRIQLLNMRNISGARLGSFIEKRIGKVKGNFRQEEIIKSWSKNLNKKEKLSFKIAKFKIKCGSGTYVRSISHELGASLGIPALAFSIERTKLGKWSKI